VHVPYKGSAQIDTDLIGGHIDAAIDGITGLTPHIRSGKLRLLGAYKSTRVPAFDVPAVAESVPGYDSRGWFGFIAPAGTPREIVALLNAEINRALNAPEIREKLEATGLTVLNESPEAFAKTLREDYDIYGKLIKTIGLQPQ